MNPVHSSLLYCFAVPSLTKTVVIARWLQWYCLIIMASKGGPQVSQNATDSDGLIRVRCVQVSVNTRANCQVCWWSVPCRWRRVECEQTFIRHFPWPSVTFFHSCFLLHHKNMLWVRNFQLKPLPALLSFSSLPLQKWIYFLNEYCTAYRDIVLQLGVQAVCVVVLIV
jgi:hypothetical protein